jgi:hypothetical protein
LDSSGAVPGLGRIAVLSENPAVLRSGSVPAVGRKQTLGNPQLGALVAVRTAAGEKGIALPVVCTSERIMKLFTITGLDGVFDIHPDLDSAVAAAKA